MELATHAIYSVLELPTTPQVHRDYRQQQKATSSRSTVFCYVATTLGLLMVILVSLLLYQWIQCRGSASSPCANCPSCPDLWVKYGDDCYYFSVEKKDWNSSLEFCLAKDSQLLMLRDSQEMNLLKNFLHDELHWLGLRNNTGWKWEDGSALNFSRVYSNSLVQKCGTIGEGGLQASSCEVPFHWVCKKARL